MRTILRTVRKRTKKTIRYIIKSPDYMYLLYIVIKVSLLKYVYHKSLKRYLPTN